MTAIITILCVIVVFGMIILIHELGHFLTAKMFGVKVHEFAIGMGPKLFGKQKGDTFYSVRLIPMGGYVKMEGEDENSEDPAAFNNKKPWQRLIILVAGAFMNLLLGFVLLVTLNAASPRLPVVPTLEVAAVQEGYGAEAAGMQAGDKLLEIDGNRLHTRLDLILALDGKEQVSVTVDRGGQKHTLPVTLTEDGGSRVLGIRQVTEEKNVGNLISYSFFETFSIIKLTYQSFFGMFNGTVAVEQMSGPVGIVTEISNAAQSGFFDVMFLALIISLNLGVVNLFPLPALDGGRIVFVLWEMITKKKLKPEHEGLIHFIGFMILILFMLYVTKNDIARLFAR